MNDFDFRKRVALSTLIPARFEVVADHGDVLGFSVEMNDEGETEGISVFWGYESNDWRDNLNALIDALTELRDLVESPKID